MKPKLNPYIWFSLHTLSRRSHPSWILALCIGLLGWSASAFASGERYSNEDLLRPVFDKFPLLELTRDSAGKATFQTLDLTKQKPVVIKGDKFYGFRFRVPPRNNHENFAWAYMDPNLHSDFSGWYVMPKTGSFDNPRSAESKNVNGNEGFAYYYYEKRISLENVAKLLPADGKFIAIQPLSGESLKDGETYLIYFDFISEATKNISITFAFTDVAANNFSDQNAADLETALNLKHVPGSYVKAYSKVADMAGVSFKTNPVDLSKMSSIQKRALGTVDVIKTIRNNNGFVSLTNHIALNADLDVLEYASNALIDDDGGKPNTTKQYVATRSEEHTSELQSQR